MKLTSTSIRSNYRKMCSDHGIAIAKLNKRYQKKLKRLQAKCKHPCRARVWLGGKVSHEVCEDCDKRFRVKQALK